MYRRNKNARLLTGGIVGVPPGYGDEHWDDVTLLLNGEDATIADASSASTVITKGTSVTRDTSVYKYGSGSLNFSRSAGEYSYVSYSGPPIGQGDYTVEFWWKPNALNTTPGNDDESLWDVRAGSTSFPFIFYTPANNVPQIVLLEGGAYRIQSTVTLSLNTWYHVALVRNAGVSEMFINGASQGTWSPNSATNITATTHWIGRRYQAYLSAYFGLDGYLDDFRLTPGVARYTGPFDRPTASFPINAPVVGRRGVGTEATLRTRGYIGAAPAGSGGMLTLYDRYIDTLS